MSSIIGETVVGQHNYDRAKELKEFDETRAGVKGLVDSGVVKIPKIFIHPNQNLQQDSYKTDHLHVPVIDFNGLDERSERRAAIVEQIREASETWGFFQIINHGVPTGAMDDLLDASRRFHEQPREAKMEFYSRDSTQRARFYSNGDLYASPAASWRDTLSCSFPDDDVLDPQYLPLVCRKEIDEYGKYMIKLRTMLSELLSEALGLSSDYLSGIQCMERVVLTCHYYPACPEPELTMGIPKHSDGSFLTILLQDKVGGLQVLHQNNWVDVPPKPGALVANLGDFMQLITNEKFKSVEHRVLVRPVTRLSVACFFTPSASCRSSKMYGPSRELLSENNPPLYKDIMINDYFAHIKSKGLDGTSVISHFRLQ